MTKFLDTDSISYNVKQIVIRNTRVSWSLSSPDADQIMSWVNSSFHLEIFFHKVSSHNNYYRRLFSNRYY